MDRWERADEIIDRVEQTSLVILLSSMIVIAFLQIVLRNLFSTGLSWGDSLVRNLVLWVSSAILVFHLLFTHLCCIKIY
jgi:TRAP-type C4-dicarboxylate transport system permease small subunit